MAGWLHLKVDIIKDGVAKYGILNRGLVGLFDCFAMRWMLKRYRNPGVIPAPTQRGEP